MEVFDILSGDEEAESDDENVNTGRVGNDTSIEKEQVEARILNDVVDDYISLAAVACQSQHQGDEEKLNDAKILHDNVNEYIPVSYQSKNIYKKDNGSVINAHLTAEETGIAKDEDKDGANHMEDEADKSDVLYSSDGGNPGGELSEDVNADDEHESLDTEDDKRSLAEQGEAFDEGETGKLHDTQSSLEQNTTI